MKLLIINTNQFARDGITNVIRNYYREMNKEDIDIDVLSNGEKFQEFEREVLDNNGTMYIINERMRSPIRYIFKLTKLIKNNKYDIVHAHGNSATLVLEMQAAKIAGCKIRIAHSHNTSCKFLFLNDILKPIFKISYTHSFACGYEAGKWLFGEQKFKVLNNAISCKKYSFSEVNRKKIRSRYNIKDENIVIGHIGAFSQIKNQSFIIDILNNLDKQYTVMMIGEGSQKKYIEEKVKRYNLNERVRFVGETNRVDEYLSAFDLILMPSLFEGLPLSLLEQQANGLQCIVSTHITREVDMSGNMVFLPLDIGEIAWAEEIQKRDLSIDRNELSQETIKKIQMKNYSIEEEAKKLQEFYKNILLKGKGNCDFK